MHIPDDQEERDRWLEALLRDPTHSDNPLLPVLESLCRERDQQRERMAKLLRVADGYGKLTHESNQALLARYDWHVRRIAKVARISDLYQKTVADLNESLRHAALHDPLTGLANRRHVTERIKEFTGLARRKGESFCIALLDIDDFKAINDRYGHAAGDRCLCAVAEAIQTSLRDYDLCARWGGEEFMLVLPDVSIEEATVAVERTLAAIKAVDLTALTGNENTGTGRSGSMSASAGLTAYRCDEASEVTIRRADAAMYEAKRQGGNRVLADDGAPSG